MSLNSSFFMNKSIVGVFFVCSKGKWANKKTSNDYINTKVLNFLIIFSREKKEC